MNILEFIQSGIIEHYCLGFCTDEEAAAVEQLSEEYPLIKNEIEKLRMYFEDQLHANAIQPSRSVKNAIMKSVYIQQAMADHRYVPLINENISCADLEKWVEKNNIKMPENDFEDIFVMELASTGQVINFIAAVKKEQAEEVHEDFSEFIYVIKGSCMMKLDGNESPYTAGEVISIHPNIIHSAIITSHEPMLALVQRQYFV